ncbi:Hypothetical protein, putative [Bodo saltans]|uniref:SET domain-containing protein n=1 Tax=Bodo saltans TaxID=75058 RepID=A0A0S4KFZ1_BODSA|nr:Hypothetical protein, putative [Bodo saltans]|eukprot:CUI14606.1 Hypothetical protein, putative [Bodo saltans]
MEFACLPGCGRSVVATRDFLPGEVVHEETAYVMTPCNFVAVGGSGSVNKSTVKQKVRRSATTKDDDVATAALGVVSDSQETASPSPPLLSVQPITNVCIACFVPIKQLANGATSQKNSEGALLQLLCGGCGSQFCSTTCVEAYSEEHRVTGECSVLRQVTTSAVRHKIPKEDFNTFVVACLVCAKAQCEGVSDQLLRSVSCNSALAKEHTAEEASGVSSSTAPMNIVDYGVETVGLGAEPPLGSFRDTCATPTLSTFEHLAHLVTNRSSMDVEIRGDFEKLHGLYDKLRAAAAASVVPQPPPSSSPIRKQSEGESTSAEHDAVACATLSSTTQHDVVVSLPPVSFDVFVSICSAFLANGFGLWNAKGNGVATGFFPRSSFFNHSCAPNIGREMVGRRAVFFAAKHIRTGEAVCLSYIDFKLHRDERRMKLKATYTFDCACPRCSDPDAIDHRERYDLALCQDCKSKVLRPEISENPSVAHCPCCKQTFAL